MNDIGNQRLVDVETEAMALRNNLSAVVITDQRSYTEAVEKRTEAANWLKNAKAFFKGMKDPAYAAWKKICSNENEVCDPVEKTISMINSELVRYDREQERLRQEHQRRLDEQARKEAEEQKLADAIHLENQGVSPETVNAILSEPIPVQAPVMAAPTYQKSNQVIYRDNWQGQCDDLSAVVKAAAKGNKTAMGLLQINQPALTQMARAMKETLADAVPGCRAVNNRTIATGRS